MQPGNRRAIIAALVANSGIALAKFVAYAFTGAASLMAESVHSVADTANQALLLWGGSAAARRATPEHPFGYGRERYFWSFVVALVIFSLGALFAIYAGIDKLRHPHELAHIQWAVGVLLLGIVLEGFSFRTAIVEANAVKGSASWWGFIRDSKSPELPVVLLEDLAALSGLVIALAGVGLATLTGDARFDAAGSIAIGLLLGLVAIVLAIEMKSLLMGEAASPDMERRIRESTLALAHVHQIIHMRTQHLGPDQLLVAAKIEFDGDLSFRELSDAIDGVEAAMRAVVPLEVVIYIEPDVYDSAEDSRLVSGAAHDADG
jgi:cation diffusion facilitator family transporter